MTTDDEREATLADYARWLRSWGASPATIGARVWLARSRHRAWGNSPADLTPERLESWLADLEDRNWTKPTYHANLSDYCAWLVATGRLESSPMGGVRRAKRPNKRPRPLSEAEVRRVLAVAAGDTRTWIMLALLAGLRAHEIAKLRGEDVSEDGIYVDGKGGVSVTLPCHPDLWEIAEQYPRQGYWFPSPRRDGPILPRTISTVVGRLFRECGIESGSIHRVRHVYATRLLRAGVNVRSVQQLMRHASLDTTAGYTAVDEDELRAAVNLLTAS